MTDFNSSNNRNSSRKPSNSFNGWNNLMFSKKHVKRNNFRSENGVNNSNITAIAGNWIEAIGTVITAIGSTPSTVFSQQTLNDFNIIGNILEAGGTAIAAEGEDALLDIVGDQLQAIGNITVVAGIMGNNEQTSQLLQMQGNLLQVVGLGVTINTQGKQTLLQTINNTGNIIQLIGTVIQVFANTETQEGIEMNAIGAWIQVVGAIITALSTE